MACGGPAPQPDAARLLELIAHHGPRTIEGRLAGASSHGPCSAAARPGRSLPDISCSPPLGPDSPAAREIGAALRHAAGSPPGRDPELDRALALGYLASGERWLDDGVTRLEAAVAAHPGDPAALNDLGAALLARGHRDDRPAELVRALDLVERSLAESPAGPAALFNRALIVERLGFGFAAAELWQAAAAADPASPWGREAGERAGVPPPAPFGDEALARWAAGEGDDKPPPGLADRCQRTPARVTEHALAVLLPAWARDFVAGKGSADRRLDRLESLGRRLTRAGEPTVSDAVAGLRSASPRRLRDLAEAYRLYGVGGERRSQGLSVAAGESYRRAYGIAAAGSNGTVEPIELWARFGAADASVTAGDPAAARDLLGELAAEPAVAARPALAASCHWTRGLIEVRGGAFADARLSFDRAAELYERLGDVDRLAGARALVAESLFALGLSGEAWQARRSALSELGRRPSLSLHNLLLDAALAAHEEGFGLAALRLREIDLEVARALGRPTTSAEARIWYGRTLADLGRTGRAAEELTRALEAARELADTRGLRSRLVADAQEALGALLVPSDPAAAVAALSEALPYYEASAYRWKVPTTLFSRALAWRGLGEEERARADLEAAAAEFERRDLALPPAVFRFSHFERAQAGFDEWLRLEAEAARKEAAAGNHEAAARRYEAALAVAERARRAQLLAGSRAAREHSGEPKVDPAEALRRAVAAVPAGTAVVEYAVAGDLLLTWVIHDGGLRGDSRPLGDLRERVERFARDVASPATRPALVAAQAETLHRDLVAPWIDALPADARLVFAPDRFLHQLPFAALRDPATGRWLAEGRNVSSTPGLRFFAGLDRPRSPRDTGRGVLLIGDPAFDPAEAGRLDDLPGAEAEIAEIAALYPGAERLTGAGATRPAVLEALGRAGIVHYAGHGVARPLHPWSSYLPLARPADGASGLLLASEIHGLESGPWRVVVLSACGSSASAGRLRTAGFQAQVNAFLAAGAEAVVASRWPVEDEAIRPFAVELHRGLARGLGAGEALELARRSLLVNNSDDPHLWASLELTGLG